MNFDAVFEESKQTFNVAFKEVEIIDNTRPVVIEPLAIVENGEYYAENIDGFNPVNVNIPLRYDEGFRDGFQASQDSIVLQEKTAAENGEVTADEGFTGMSKVIVAVPIKEEQEKTVEITKNGTTEVVADEGTSMSKVTVKTNVAFEGEIGKPYIDTSKITDFAYFFYKGARSEFFDSIDTSNGISFEYMFYNCALPQLTEAPFLNTSNGKTFSSMFSGCVYMSSFPLYDLSKGTTFNSMFNRSAIITVPRFDTSNGKYFKTMFANCSQLETVPFLNISKLTGNNATGLFTGCVKLKTVNLSVSGANLSTDSFSGCTSLTDLTIGEGWAVNIYLHYSNALTQESLHGMIENLADRTGQTAKTFQVGATNLEKVDEEHLTMLQSKNWNYS